MSAAFASLRPARIICETPLESAAVRHPARPRLSRVDARRDPRRHSESAVRVPPGVAVPVPRSFVVSTYGRVLRALYSRTGLPWTVHDQVIRINPQVRYLVPHEPEPALFDFLARHDSTRRHRARRGAFLGIYAIWRPAGGPAVGSWPSSRRRGARRMRAAISHITPWPRSTTHRGRRFRSASRARCRVRRHADALREQPGFSPRHRRAS